MTDNDSFVTTGAAIQEGVEVGPKARDNGAIWGDADGARPKVMPERSILGFERASEEFG